MSSILRGPPSPALAPHLPGNNGNISADPLFVNSASDFHLQATSPAIDAGSNAAPSLPTQDIAGNSRILDGKVIALQSSTWSLRIRSAIRLTLFPVSLAFADQNVGSTSAALSSTITNTASTATTSAASPSLVIFRRRIPAPPASLPKGSCAVNVISLHRQRSPLWSPPNHHQ